jgi:sugar O-acyltransferase (sialic acid O-acetyltransferase NeuD family)
MNRSLVLLGAGGLARETTELVRAHNSSVDATRRHHLVGLLDDDPARHGRLVGGLTVLGSRDWVHDHDDTGVVVCIAHPRRPLSRLGVVRSLELDPTRYPTLVHPGAFLAGSTRIGVGGVIHAGVTCTADVTVGDHVVIMPGVVLTHDVVIGHGVTLASGALVAGGVHIDDGAYVGAGALLREGCRVGAGATVGMGAVVTRDVDAGTTWVGNPARPLHSPTVSAQTLATTGVAP